MCLPQADLPKPLCSQCHHSTFQIPLWRRHQSIAIITQSLMGTSPFCIPSFQSEICSPEEHEIYHPNFPPSFYPRAKHFYFSPQPGTQRYTFLTDFSHHLRQGLLGVSQFTILTSILKPKLHAKCHITLK